MAEETEDNFENLISEMEAEQRVGEKAEVVEETPTEITYAHIQILEEEGLTKEDMPEDIRKMIIAFDKKMRMAKSRKSSEKIFLQIQNLSTLIADKIIDFLEKEDAVVVKKEDGGGFDDGGSDIFDDGVSDIEDPEIDEEFEDGGSVEKKEKSSIFGGILGGIFDF
jgi:hypothetical protein